MKWSLFFLTAVAVLGYVCDAQYPSKKAPPHTPIRRPPRPGERQKPILRPQDPKDPPFPGQDQRVPVPQQPSKMQDGRQEKTTFETPFLWRFPLPPERVPEPVITIEVSPPVRPAEPVIAYCTETEVRVEVKKDIFGTGKLMRRDDITMGGCPVLAEDAQVLFFQSALTECGGVLRVEADQLVYSFSLLHIPTPLANTGIVRTGIADFIVECHYPRTHIVSSEPLIPAWVPFSDTKVSEELLYFSLRLMTADWMYERAVSNYFLGHMINIEASVYEYHHKALRIYVDSCVATMVPEITQDCPRYDFIENYGCMVDAKHTGSRSLFLRRESSNKLQIQLEAFMFQSEDSSDGKGGMGGKGVKTTGDSTMRIYITCSLKARVDVLPVDSTHKSCSYIGDRWMEAFGVDDGVCSCCDSVCSPGPPPPPHPVVPGYEPKKGVYPQEGQRLTRDVKTDTATPPPEWNADEWKASVSLSFTVEDVDAKGMD